MEIVRLLCFAVATTLLIKLFTKSDTYGSELSIFIRLVGSIILLIFIATQLSTVIQIIYDLAARIKMDNIYLNIVLKVVGIAYLAEFGYQLCKDASEDALGSAVQFAGKVMIFVVASPVIFALVEMITNLL